METPITFEWDDAKAAANLAKHGARFEVATNVFNDPRRVEDDTTRIADAEERFKTIGRIDDKLFAVVWTKRGDACRLISARRANRKEERHYGNR